MATNTIIMVDTILVTGSNGQLGRSLRALAEKDQKNLWVFCSRQDLDITNREKIEQIFVEHQPTHCINCAAFTNVRLAEKEPDNARRINVDGVDNLIEACNNFDTTLVHLSTDYVFDGEKSSPYTEDDEVNPLNVYGQTKAAGEALVAQRAKKGYIVRSSWVYAEKYGQNFYRSILAKAKTGEQLEVVNDQTGTPTSTSELAHYLLRLIGQSPSYGIYHFAGDKIQTWFSFAKDILAVHGLGVEVMPVATAKDELRRPLYSPLISIKPLNNEL